MVRHHLRERPGFSGRIYTSLQAQVKHPLLPTCYPLAHYHYSGSLPFKPCNDCLPHRHRVASLIVRCTNLPPRKPFAEPSIQPYSTAFAAMAPRQQRTRHRGPLLSASVIGVLSTPYLLHFGSAPSDPFHITHGHREPSLHCSFSTFWGN